MKLLPSTWRRSSAVWINITLEDCLPKSLGRPWPPLALPWDFPPPRVDLIYNQVLNELLHGKRDGITIHEFSSVLSDILLGVTDGLRRYPVSLLTLDGQLLQKYALSPNFQVDTVTLFSEFDLNQEAQPRAKCLLHALRNVTVDQGMPPASHPLVRKNIVEPSLKKVFINFNRAITQVEFVELFRKLVLEVALQLKTTPVTVAHSDKAYDGSTISQFLTKKYSLEKTLDTTWKSLPKDQHGALPREYLRVGLDIIAPAAGLPPFGAVEKMDRVVSEIFKMVEADEDRVLNQKEFNKLMLEILGSIILQLQGNPISVSSNAVVTDNPADTGFLPS